MSGQSDVVPKQTSKKHIKTPTDQSRLELEKLMKDGSKSVLLPPPDEEKTIRAPREMTRNVQGSSSGAGSGEFHRHKASRRREYDHERQRPMEEERTKEGTSAKIERRKREREEETETRTAQHISRGHKKKDAVRTKGNGRSLNNSHEGLASKNESGSNSSRPTEDQPFKKRRTVEPDHAPSTQGSTVITVVANDRTGNKVRVKVASEDTVEVLKKMIAAQMGTDWQKIVLKKWYTTFKNHITLGDYEIHDGASLEMYYS